MKKDGGMAQGIRAWVQTPEPEKREINQNSSLNSL
jgi:hypothetical protein